MNIPNSDSASITVSKQTIILVLAVVLLLANISWTVFLHLEVSELNNDVSEVEQNQQTMYDFVGAAADNETGVNSTNTTRGGSFSSPRQSKVPLVGFDSATEEARVVSLETANVPGNQVYMDITGITYQPSIQSTMLVSRYHAIRLVGAQMNDGFVVRVGAPDSWQYVGGSSSGLAATAAMIATHERWKYDQRVLLTGSVERDGSVGPVQHVRAKAIAAREHGYQTIVVPAGQEVDVEGVEVVEVADVETAMRYAIVAERQPLNESKTGGFTPTATETATPIPTQSPS
jgi:hypothetical protein